MTTTDNNTAYDYALLIRGEILALELLLENKSDIDSDLENIRNGEPVEMDADTLAECVAAQNELGIEEWDEDIDLVSDYLNNTCLDMTVLRATSNDRERVEILRTCGGPRCDITRDTNDGTVVEISVHDGGVHSVVRVNVANVASSLDEIAGCY